MYKIYNMGRAAQKLEGKGVGVFFRGGDISITP